MIIQLNEPKNTQELSMDLGNWLLKNLTQSKNTQEVAMDATLGNWSCLNWPELIVAEAFSSD